MPPNQRDRVASPSPKIDQLVEPISTVLSTAAVIGDEFEVAILAAATGLGIDQLRPHLAELDGAEIVHRVDDEKYRFVDPTARRTIYDGIEAARRAELHRQVGEAIEGTYGTESNDHIDELAYHFSQGLSHETANKTIDYMTNAGQRSYRLKAYERAGGYWRTALKMMPSSNVNRPRQVKLLHLLSEEVISSGPEAVAYLERALALLESLNATQWIAATHSRLGLILSSTNLGCLDMPRAMIHLEKAKAIFKSLPEDRPNLIQLYQRLGVACLTSVNSNKGYEFTLRGMELSEQEGDWFWWILLAMANMRHMVAMGRLAEAFALQRRAYEKAESFEDPYCGSTVAWLGGVSRSDLLDYGDALDGYLAELPRPRTASSVSRTIALKTEAAHMYQYMGELEAARRLLQEIRGPGASTALPFEDGDWERNAVDIAEKLSLARTNGNLESISLRTWWLGIGLRLAGKFERAEHSLLESVKINREAPNLPRLLGAAQELSLLYFDLGRREDARSINAECRRILAQGEDWRGLEGGVIRGQALVSVLDRRFIDADAELERAIGIHDRYRNRWLKAEAYLYWGRALVAAGDKRRAADKLERALEVYREIGAGQAFVDRVNETRAKAGVTVESPPALATSTSPTCIFTRDHAIWTISHRNRTFRIKDMKGLRYIAHLLEHPGEEFHVLDLLNAIDGVTGSRETNRETKDDLRITSDLGDAGELLDQRSKIEYRRRRNELRAELDEAEAANDRGAAQRIRAELEMIEEQLASAMGLGGRDRKAGDHSERARDRIRKSIHKSLESIRENDPSLGHHLTTCIRTGYLCSYSPDPASR